MTPAHRPGPVGGRCYGAGMAARRVPAGGDCGTAAFPDAGTTGPAAATQTITSSTGSTAGGDLRNRALAAAVAMSAPRAWDG